MAAAAVPADPAQAVISGPIAQLLEANFGILNDVGAGMLCLLAVLPLYCRASRRVACMCRPRRRPRRAAALAQPASAPPLSLSSSPLQFRSNMADFRVHENTALLVAFRDNILAIINQMESMGGVMAQMPQLPVR